MAEDDTGARPTAGAVAEDAPRAVRLAEEWDLWPWACLRSAGFAASELLRLAAPAAAAAVDRLIEAEDDGAGVDQAARHAESVWATDNLRVAHELRAWARRPDLREALCWQNLEALHTGVDALLRHPPGLRNKRMRQHALLLARYVQRYCAKNDTIGFFGPVAWARVGTGDERLRVQPGPSLLGQRRVYFEEWAIDALARTIAGDPAVRRHLPPRRLPTVRLEGERVHYPVGRSTVLPPAHARALAACDGERTALSIVRDVMADETLGLSSEQQAADVLDDLAASGLIAWTIDVPTGAAHPEAALRERLEGVGDQVARVRALAALDALEAGRRNVEAARGNPERLAAALHDLDATFTSVTGAAATRRAGQAYAGRGLVYEDSVRAVDVEVGGALLAELGPPLSLVLASARWYTHAIALRYRGLLEGEYHLLREEKGSGVVDGVLFWQRALRHFPAADQAAPAVGAVLDELHARWRRVLGAEPGPARLVRRAAELRPAVEEAFAAPGPGWHTALHHSPDVMIAARDAAAVARGEGLLVLGELHVALPLPATHAGLRHSQDEQRVVARMAADRPRPAVFPVIPRRLASRADFWSPLDHDFDLELGRTRSRRPRQQVLEIADLVVDEGERGPFVRTRDGRVRGDLLEFFEYYLAMESAMRFSLLPSDWPHTPRVTIDGLVVQREQWRVPCAEIEFARRQGEFERFRGARAWARRLGLPRFLFYRLPGERKPYYLDLDSPPYVDLFAHGVRRSDSVTLSEMLPGLHETWLVDAAGRSYTSELRLAVVDRRAAGAS